MIGLCIAAAVLVSLWTVLRGCRRSSRQWKELERFIYAHRGLHRKPTIPENSLAAFRRAADRGYGAELDIHLMKDGRLAVIHDSSLQRTAGADVRIEDLTAADLSRYPLEESEERIPLLEDVLALYGGKAPLIVELKPERGNHRELAAAAAALLDNYHGAYCIESFDPRAVAWFRKHRPSVCRGQLSQNFIKHPEGVSSPVLRFLLTHLLLNVLSRPDFVAYRMEDRHLWSYRLHRLFHRPNTAWWTLKTPAELETACREKAAAIFENLEP